MQAPRVNLSEKIRTVLEAEINSGHLPAGSKIDEQALMDRFDVSRTPAREALQHLISAGLVTALPRQGGIVTSLSLAEYVGMLEILLELEGLAARLAARRMPLSQRRQLELAHSDCERAAKRDNTSAYAVANKTFHETIYDGTHNEILARQLRAMRSRMRNPQHLMFDRPGRMRSSLIEHKAVLAAILSGDEEGACKAMKDHISSGGNVYADSIAAMSSGQRASEPAPVKRSSAVTTLPGKPRTAKS